MCVKRQEKGFTMRTYNSKISFPRSVSTGVLLFGVFTFGACTKQGNNTFRIQPAVQTFAVRQDTQSKVDMLWVVDNSASMDPSQEKLRKAFVHFANTYMKPNWDIRAAVITTDTYLANPAFATYLNAEAAPGKKRSPDVYPIWNRNYAHLLPGIHDGPIPALCDKNVKPEFFKSFTKCAIRDQSPNTTKDAAINACLSAQGADSYTACVNTAHNNSIHSGTAIINTLNGNPDALLRNFLVNISTGTAGSGSERGMSSVLQLLSDNEDPTSPLFQPEDALFRKGSQRIIVFVSDEDDQSLVMSQNSSQNSSTMLTTKTDYFEDPSNPPKSTCPRSVDGHNYFISDCVNPSKLVPVATVKEKLDSFFRTLDGNPYGNPNYTIGAIVTENVKTIQALQKMQADEQSANGLIVTIDHDKGLRYLELVQLMKDSGARALDLDIGEEDYTPIMNQIGDAVVNRFSTFQLKRAPADRENTIVYIVHGDGSKSRVAQEKYTVTGKTLTLTDPELVKSLMATDRIEIGYEPKTVQ